MPPSRILPEPPTGSKKIRVLLAIGSLEGGGSERQVLGILKHLDRSRFEPLLYLIYRRGDLLAAVPDDVPIFSFWERHPSVRFYFPGRIHRMQICDLCAVIREQRIDVVYDRGFHMTLVAGPAAHRTRRPRVATIVSLPQRELPHAASRFLFLKRRLLARHYARAHTVLTVSEAVAEAAARYYRLPRDRFTTIHSPIDLAGLDRAASTVTPPPRREGVVQIVCVGRMTPEKGQAVLLDALARLGEPRLDLWMVGEGPLRGPLQEQAARLGIERQVRFTGHLPSAAAAIAAADLLCLPSFFEGLPNVVMEALALGVPVIATEAGGTPELLRPPREAVGEGETTEPPRGLLVPPGDPAALAAAIGRFLEDRHGFAQRAALAQAAFRRGHAVERVVPQIARRLLEASGAASPSADHS